MVAREPHPPTQRWRGTTGAPTKPRITTVRSPKTFCHESAYHLDVNILTTTSRVPPLISPQVIKTLPLFIIAMTISLFAFFNYQKQESSVVTATLYALRTNPMVREQLGDEIYFASKYPWIKGEINQLHGRIDVSFWVKGTKRAGEVKLRCRRRGRGGLYYTQEYSLTMEDGTKMELYDPEGNAIDPFQAIAVEE